MEDYSIAREVVEWNPQRKRRGGRLFNPWKDWIRGSNQRRILKGEECFD
jgi:hypothetical protein